jgi:hypothetical protein
LRCGGSDASSLILIAPAQRICGSENGDAVQGGSPLNGRGAMGRGVDAAALSS